MKNNLNEISLDVEDWEQMVKNRTEWQRAVPEGCEIYEGKNLAHAELKGNLRNDVLKSLNTNIVGWNCERCDRILLSNVLHERQPFHAVPPPRQIYTVCVIYGKVCKSTAGF